MWWCRGLRIQWPKHYQMSEVFEDSAEKSFRTAMYINPTSFRFPYFTKWISVTIWVLIDKVYLIISYDFVIAHPSHIPRGLEFYFIFLNFNPSKAIVPLWGRVWLEVKKRELFEEVTCREENKWTMFRKTLHLNIWWS